MASWQWVFRVRVGPVVLYAQFVFTPDEGAWVIPLPLPIPDSTNTGDGDDDDEGLIDLGEPGDLPPLQDHAYVRALRALLDPAANAPPTPRMWHLDIHEGYQVRTWVERGVGWTRVTINTRTASRWSEDGEVDVEFEGLWTTRA